MQDKIRESIYGDEAPKVFFFPSAPDPVGKCRIHPAATSDCICTTYPLQTGEEEVRERRSGSKTERECSRTRRLLLSSLSHQMTSGLRIKVPGQNIMYHYVSKIRKCLAMSCFMSNKHSCKVRNLQK